MNRGLSIRAWICFVVALAGWPGWMWAADWPMYAHDAQRTGWAKEETTFTPKNVHRMELKWKVQVKNEFKYLSALTAPIIAAGVETAAGVKDLVYVAGVSNNVSAIDAADGSVVWRREFSSRVLPGSGPYQGTFLCPNGITATPVIDRGAHTLYVIAMDGRLFSLDLATGKNRIPPLPFVTPFAKTWSMSVVDGIVYTATSQGCGDAPSGFYSIEVTNPRRPVVRQLILSPTDTAGIWGVAGPVVGENHRIYGQTADGKSDPAGGEYSNSVVAGSVPALELADYFTPPDWQQLSKIDLDLGSSSPVWFTLQGHDLLAGGAKQGVLYLMDADSLGGPSHAAPMYTSPTLGNDGRVCCKGKGIWGALSTWQDDEGQRWLYVPIGGPLSQNAPDFPLRNGPSPNGSIVAFKVAIDAASGKPTVVPAWASGDLNVPSPAVITNGVIFAFSTGENVIQGTDRLKNTRPATLVALDAKTGRLLYQSGDTIQSFVHFTGLAIANGRVYAVDHDSYVYCFGLK